MKKALDWIKENPISSAAAVVALLSVVVVVYYLFVAAGSLSGRVAEDVEPTANKLDQLFRGKVLVPDPDPNNPPIEYGPMVVTQEVIDRVETIFGTIGGQRRFIVSETERLNKAAHVPFILPALPDNQLPAIRVQSAQIYVASHRAMLDSKENALGVPSFRAGGPPSGEVVGLALAQTVTDFTESVGATNASELTEAQARDLYALQQVTLISLLTERARSLDFYADVPIAEDLLAPGESSNTPTPGGFDSPLRPGSGSGNSLFNRPGTGSSPQAGTQGATSYGPFHIADWADDPTPPSNEQLWDGQVQLWITRDIMTAIHKTNRVGQKVSFTNAEGETREIPENVITAPIKRLLDLQVVSGYVGLHIDGGSMAGPGSGGNPLAAASGVGSNFDSEFGGASPGGMPPPSGGLAQPGSSLAQPGGASGAGATSETHVYPMPALATLPLPTEPMEGNFFFGPTGRRSNSIYDVRHTWLKIHIEWSKLPEFCENLRETNFMTILNVKVTDVDEYSVLRQGGYVYGEGDVVEVSLLIESLWFRSWTIQYMPKSVRERLAVPADDPTQLIP